MDLKARGRQIMLRMFGEEYLAKRQAARTELNGPLYDLIETANFGTVWAGEGIDQKQRCLVTVALLVALNRLGPARSYMTAALKLGATMEELRDVLMQTAIYAGVPAAAEGFKVAEEVLLAANIPVRPQPTAP